VGEVLKAFLAGAEQQLASLTAAIETGDAQQLSRCAHALKSSTANLGAEELSALYRRLEALGRAGELEDANALLHEVRLAHQFVVRRAHEILEEAA
jgi:HPt (histidine-containing phosphotransfer) domain-containing protein